MSEVDQVRDDVTEVEAVLEVRWTLCGVHRQLCVLGPVPVLRHYPIRSRYPTFALVSSANPGNLSANERQAIT
jgi:hypothetical protein